jgi:hypothetical protein
MAKEKDVNDILREEGDEAAREYHDAAEPFDENNPKFKNDKDSGDNREQEATVLKSARASTFKIVPIKWQWPNRIAEGKLAIIAGLPDEGKGQLLAYVAAQITLGGSWPCEEGRAPQGNVSYCPPRTTQMTLLSLATRQPAPISIASR